MKILHAKSPCCFAKVNRFGKRRRQCASCRKTWRIRKKKRGRKLKRASVNLIIRFFQKRSLPLRIAATVQGSGKDAVQLLLQRSLKAYLKKYQSDWLGFLSESGPLIAVADAIWYYAAGQKYAIYVILLRPVNANEAVICPPVILPGHENSRGWNEAFRFLPKALEKRIIALVSDGGTGLMLLAKTKPWIIQRCHFHLISAVQNYLTTGPRSPHREFALQVMNLVRQVLQTKDKELITKVETLRRQTSSRGLKRVLGGLIENLPDFHAYLHYPYLNLPTTSNTAESFIQCLRDLMYRCRGFRSLEALQRWLTAAAIFKRTMRCNGRLSTKLNR